MVNNIDESDESDYGKNFSSELTEKEKVSIMENTFQEKDIKNLVKYPANFLASQFELIDGFDARWSSLISNNPLLFEDIDYLRVKQYIDSRITEEEIEAYKKNELREMYATFDNMLMCNIKYYDRIMSFATMIFMHYVKINEYNYTDRLKNIPIELEMTPTRLWCCALTGISSTAWEINYAWGGRELVQFKNGKQKLNIIPITQIPIKGSTKSIFEVSYSKLYKNPTFARFVEYSALRCETQGFKITFTNDITPNEKLAQVCSKFTCTSMALGETQLKTISDYIEEIEDVKKRLYYSLKKCLREMFTNDESQFNVWIFNNEFYINTVKFSLKVSKENGVISKTYLSNAYECFLAEEYMVKSNREQIEWLKYSIPAKYNYDMQILKTILEKMLDKSYKEINCIKRMEDGVVSKIRFNGIFGNVNAFEELIYNSTILRTNKITYSKRNMANYIVERGYFLIGTETDITQNFPTDCITSKDIISHYSKYCIPILQHLDMVIMTHNNSKNEIIDVVCKGEINPLKLNNKNIKRTQINEIDYKDLMSVALGKQQKRNLLLKKQLFQVVYDYER